MATHHTGRPWVERIRPQVLERDGWLCMLPRCKAAEWLTNPPARDRRLAEQARAWARLQPTTRTIWRDAPRTPTARSYRLHPLSASVDMVVPKSQGGDDRDLTRLRASHLLCNMSRGAGQRERGRYTTSKPRVANT
mgnify:FL=1